MSLPFAIPALETSRLTLREPRPTDGVVLGDFFQSPRSQGIGGPWPRDEAWLDFLLLAAEEGKGHATEAPQAARHFAFGILQRPGIVSHIDARNDRAIRVAERPGAEFDAEASTEDLFVYRYTRAEGAK